MRADRSSLKSLYSTCRNSTGISPLDSSNSTCAIRSPHSAQSCKNAGFACTHLSSQISQSTWDACKSRAAVSRNTPQPCGCSPAALSPSLQSPLQSHSACQLEAVCTSPVSWRRGANCLYAQWEVQSHVVIAVAADAREAHKCKGSGEDVAEHSPFLPGSEVLSEFRKASMSPCSMYKGSALHTDAYEHHDQLTCCEDCVV